MVKWESSIIDLPIWDKRYLIDKIPLEEVIISDKTPFSVGSDAIYMKLPGNKLSL